MRSTMRDAVIEVRRPTEADRRSLAELAAGQQVHPERHVAYLGRDADSIAEEMIAEDVDWTVASSVAGRGGRDIGWLMGSVDATMGRVWWFGPFVDIDDEEWEGIADELYRSARAVLPSGTDEEEFAPDSRHRLLIGWATALGFDVDTGSAVLVLTDSIPAPTISYRHVRPTDLDTVAPLHEQLFPRTHATGETVVSRADDTHLCLVVESAGTVTGYVAVELQPDGSGYIDYLGVAPDRRREGMGAELVRAGIAELRARGAGEVHLTVREDNHGARSLYAALGFVEERVITPIRRGFRVP